MRWIKIFEDFSKSKVSIDEIVDCIRKGGSIYTKIIKGYPNNDPNEPLTPIDVDESGVITVDIDGELFEVDINQVSKIEYQ